MSVAQDTPSNARLETLRSSFAKAWAPEYLEAFVATFESLRRTQPDQLTAFLENCESCKGTPITYDKSSLAEISKSLPQVVAFSSTLVNVAPHHPCWTVTTDKGHAFTWDRTPYFQYPTGTSQGVLRFRDWDELLNGEGTTAIYFRGGGFIPLLRGGKTIGLLEFSTKAWPLGDDRLLQEGYQIEFPVTWKTGV